MAGWLHGLCVLTQLSALWLHPLALVKLPWCVGVVATICSTDERHLERDSQTSGRLTNRKETDVAFMIPHHCIMTPRNFLCRAGYHDTSVKYHDCNADEVTLHSCSSWTARTSLRMCCRHAHTSSAGTAGGHVCFCGG